MKVYRIIPREGFKYVLPAKPSYWRDWKLDFDCSPRGSSWKPLPVYFPEPLLESGDFLSLSPDTLVLSARAASQVGRFLEVSGEFLPLAGDGAGLHLFNTTLCINCLDGDSSSWLLGGDGKRLAVKSYCFHADRFFVQSVFKIPETSRGEILTWERQCDPETEFKAAVEERGLRGLEFKEIWCS